MLFPRLQETDKYRDMTTVFGGYNHRISCTEEQFYDMKNMSSSYYPILSPRDKRGILKTFTNPQGLLDKEDIWWIDNMVLYKNGEAITLEDVVLSSESPKTMAKMGAFIIVMPDKIWIDTSKKGTHLDAGYMENKTTAKGVTFSLCEQTGKVITWHNAEYYKTTTPKDGDYMVGSNSSGSPSLKVYSESTGIWMNVTSTYVQIKAEGIGKGFEKEDGINISGVLGSAKAYLDDIFINDDGEGVYSTNTYIIDKTDDVIVIPAIYKCRNSEGNDNFPDLELSVIRKVPDLEFITECNNRLWGCSKDGHEVYCSKLGDVKNWNCFRGVSTDSWAATVGSDGKFTGAINYLGYPMFFKEDGLLKIAVSATGGHQTKETKCRGVQAGSDRSMVILNENLYYKSPMGVCIYNGSLPYSISDALGDIRYSDAVAGSLGDKYYVSMKDAKGEYSLFCFDSKNGIWCKEDDVNALYFLKYKDDLYFVDSDDNTMKSIGGTVLWDVPEKASEDDVEWFCESGVIGYSSPDNKYVGRITIRLTLEVGTNVDFYIQYDSAGEWEHKLNMSGKGTKTFSIPIIPKRCDHFKYRIKGIGGCKIHSITKTIEQGSEG